MEEKRCCKNCKNLVGYPRNNSYGDIDYLCIKTGYFCSGITKDATKVQRFSPGGKLLDCVWEEKRVPARQS